MNKKTNKKRVLAIAGTGLLATNLVGGILLRDKNILKVKAKENIDDFYNRISPKLNKEENKTQDLLNEMIKYNVENPNQLSTLSKEKQEQLTNYLDKILAEYDSIIKSIDELKTNKLITSMQKMSQILVSYDIKDDDMKNIKDNINNLKFYSKIDQLSNKFNKIYDFYNLEKDFNDLINFKISPNKDKEIVEKLNKYLNLKDIPQEKQIKDFDMCLYKIMCDQHSKLSKDTEWQNKNKELGNLSLEDFKDFIGQDKNLDKYKNTFIVLFNSTGLLDESNKNILSSLYKTFKINKKILEKTNSKFYYDKLKKDIEFLDKNSNNFPNYTEEKEFVTNVKTEDLKETSVQEINQKINIIKQKIKDDYSSKELNSLKEDIINNIKCLPTFSEQESEMEEYKQLNLPQLIQTKVTEEIKKAQQLLSEIENDKSVEKLNELKNLLDTISDTGLKKSDLSTIKQLNSKYENFEKELVSGVISNLDKLVEECNNNPSKENLEKLLSKIEELKLDSKKEEYKTKYKKILVDYLKNEKVNIKDKKEFIQNIISEINKKYDVQKINDTYTAINEIQDEEVKKELLNNLNSIVETNDKEKINSINKIINELKSNYSEDKLNQCKQLIKELPNSNIKDSLEKSLNTIKPSEKTKEEPKSNINLESIKTEINKIDIENIDIDDISQVNKLQTKLNNLQDSKEKTELQEKINKIINKMKEKIEVVVTSAKGTKDIKDIAKARDYVNKLPEGKDKEELQTKLNNIEIKGFDESTKSNVTGDMDVVVESNPTIEMTLSTNLLNIKDYNGLEDIEIPNAFSITVSSGLSFNLNVQALDNLKNDKGNIITIDHMTLKAHEGKEITVSKDKKETLVTNHKHGKDIKFDFDVKLKADSSIVPDIYKTTLKFEASQK